MAQTPETGAGTERPRGGAACYAFGVVFPLIYLCLTPWRRQQRFLRFHCIQCLGLFALMVPLEFWSPLARPAAVALPLLFVAWLAAMIQAGRGKWFRIPILGQLAARLSLTAVPQKESRDGFNQVPDGSTSMEAKIPAEPRNAAATRLIRMMKISFLAFGVLLIYVMIKAPAHTHAAPKPTFEWTITVLALAAVAAGFLAPQLPRRAGRLTRDERPESAALNQWLRVRVLSLACFNGCMLFGFMLHFVGARVQLVEVLFATGVISLVFWRPGDPP